MNTAEADRRHSNAELVEAYLVARPRQWVPAHVLAQIGGFCAWRTRVSDARRRIESGGRGTVEWNHQVRTSAYRYVPPPVPAVAPTQPQLWEAL